MYSMNDATQVGNNTIKIDLTNYALKDDTATKIDIEDLKIKLSNKLDKEGSHKHAITDIEELTQALNEKLSNKLYSYKTLINDTENIDYLNNLKTQLFEIVKNKQDKNGYKFSIDDMTGDLNISLNGIVICSYNKSANNWIFNGINLNEFITETQTTLKNHYDAINIIMDSK